MCASHSPFHPSDRSPFLGLLGLLGALLTGGCATTSPPPTPHEPPAAVAAAPLPEFVPVTRYGRYTLIELVPDLAQRDLMQQVVDISIPPIFDVTVGDALRYVLLRSGYRLCNTPDADTLYALPLPAADLHLGPLALRDALLTLAGSDAWKLSIDDATREVCFSRHVESESTPAPASAVTAPTVPAVPSATSQPEAFPFDDIPPWERQP